MVGENPGQTFISYSRKDGADHAAWLRKWLEQQHLSVWQDIVALEGGRDWWSQIDAALRSPKLEHFILVVTPAALTSTEVRREIRLARQEAKTVCPVAISAHRSSWRWLPRLRKRKDSLSNLPRWLGQVYDLDLLEHRSTLIRVLKAESRPWRVPKIEANLPTDFVKRPREFDALKRLLLDAKGDAVAGISAALRGAGGYGKTTLALALALDPDIQDAYFDGILWAELGEKPVRLLSTLSDLIVLLTGERPAVDTIDGAAAKLGEALGDRRILLIVDDLWREQDLRPFLQGGPYCVRLVTTRIDSVLPSTALRHKVDAMQASEALSLISAGLPPDETARERANLATLAARLGEWAQLLKIVNGFLRERVGKAREPLSGAIIGANNRLDAKGLGVFDARDETDRARTVARTIEVSLDLLTEEERARFVELAVFPEDAEVPLCVAQRLWKTTGALPDFESEDLLSRLHDLSLLLDLDLGRRIIRLHDTIRHFLRERAGPGDLAALHKRVAVALEDAATAEPDERMRRYLYVYLPHHFAEANEREKLDALLFDPGWLLEKLVETNPQALVADYQLYGLGEAQNLIGRTLRLTTGICARDPRQLPQQLIGRLGNMEVVTATSFVDRARRLIFRPALVPIRSTLTPPGAETARLDGDLGSILALCLLPDGRLASSCQDGTIRLWDAAAGVETARLEQAHNAMSLCVLPDGRLAAGLVDGAIRLWDVAAAKEAATLEGHTDVVRALCMLPDGRLASGSADRTIRLWDVTTKAETARLEAKEYPSSRELLSRHAFQQGVQALCALPDGRLVSSSRGLIWFWDTVSGAETLRPDIFPSEAELCLLPDGRLACGGGTFLWLWDAAGTDFVRLGEWGEDYITALSLLPDEQIAAGLNNGPIRVWDTAAGAETARLEGHTGSITALCLLADGHLASGSYDGTVRLWDVPVGAATRRSEGHEGAIEALCLLPDGRLASGSRDTTIRLWDTATGTEVDRFEGHTREISTLCLLADGRLASSAYDQTIRLWDVATGAETVCLDCEHIGHVDACSLIADGRLALGTSEGPAGNAAIRLWDPTAGAEMTRLGGHREHVTTLCPLPNGRLASGAFLENSLRLWDVTDGSEPARIEVASWVNVLCLLADGRLAAGLGDRPIRLWDVATGAETARLEGHADTVTALCSLSDGRLASGSDDRTIRVWSAESAAETARLEIDAPVAALVAIAPNRLVAGDKLGLLHWLEIVD
jgi:WD40 repeat protein